MAHMSHELRTPLNSVIGFANLLLKSGSSDDEDRRDFLERIRNNGLHLLGLINQILDLSKVEAGEMSVHIESTRVDELIEDTLGQFHAQAGRDVVLEYRVPSQLAPLDTDRVKLRQVLINLIGNAIKFTERGSIVVRVIEDPVTHAAVRIEVSDTGIGIPVERQEQIFGAFQQGESGTARSYGGTGLGLAISRELCRLLGYALTVDSAPGKGSTFSVVVVPTPPAGPDLALSSDDHPSTGSPLPASA